MVESDSLCVLRWVLDSCRPPWRLMDAVEEILDLNRHLHASFSHIKRERLWPIPGQKRIFQDGTWWFLPIGPSLFLFSLLHTCFLSFLRGFCLFSVLLLYYTPWIIYKDSISKKWKEKNLFLISFKLTFLCLLFSSISMSFWAANCFFHCLVFLPFLFLHPFFLIIIIIFFLPDLVMWIMKILTSMLVCLYSVFMATMMILLEWYAERLNLYLYIHWC